MLTSDCANVAALLVKGDRIVDVLALGATIEEVLSHSDVQTQIHRPVAQG